MIRILNYAVVGFLSTSALVQIAAQSIGLEFIGSARDPIPTREEVSSGATRGWFGRTSSGYGYGK